MAKRENVAVKGFPENIRDGDSMFTLEISSPVSHAAMIEEEISMLTTYSGSLIFLHFGFISLTV
jgi:hypothetical protein